MAEAITWRNRIVGHGDEPLDAILFNPANWRIHPKAQQEALKGVLSEVGWVQDVIVNRTSGHLIDGHLRCQVAAQNGEKTIPVVYVELDENEEALILASLDPIAAMAASDRQKLDELMHQVQSDDERVQQLLADIAEKEGIDWGDEPPEDPGAQIDKAEELRIKWGVESGQLWQLGEHRLICGDCTDKAVVERVMDVPAMMLADPPYNVGLDYGDKTDDKRNPEEFWKWQHSWFELAAQKTEQQIITPGCINFEKWLIEFEPHHVCVWDKGEGANTYGRITKYWAWEPIMCHGKFERRRHTDVFRYSALGANPGHPCPKPIELWSDIIASFSDGAIFDPFLGSGTTLIACERLGRKCRAVEISPAYCAVAIERWHQMTGKTPVIQVETG